MPIAVNCPNPACAHTSRVADTAVGKTAKCSRCGRAFVVPPSAAATAVKPTTDDAGPKLAKPVSVTATVTATALQHVGRFVVRAKVGEGAFGAVYRAYDPHLDREVALKVPHAAVLDSPKRVERFLREAKAAANLRHPHIVPVFDAGTDGGRHYIAAAFIDGTKLADAVEASDGGLAFDRAARLVRELAEALAYAHQEGIVHRDVKPDNVMLDQADRVHLMDFGLAVKQDAEARLTRDGAVMGTPSYMAPEQAKGDTAAVGPAADQYACGVVLYELLTGKVPFMGPLPVVMHHHIHTEPTPPKLLRRAIPKDLETICLKALRKNPAERYADCQSLADDLRRWQEGELILARGQNLIVKLFRWMQAHATQAALITAGTMLLLPLLGVLGLAGIKMDAELARLEKEQALSERDQAVEFAKTVQQRADGAADVIIRDAEAKAMEQVKDALTEAETRFDDRVKEVTVKSDALERTVETMKMDDSLLTEAEDNLEAGRRSVAVELLKKVSREGRGRRWERVRSRCADSTAVTYTASIHGVTFSRDGERVLTSSSDKIAEICDAESGKLIRPLTGHTDSVTSGAFSRDGKRVLTGSSDKTARIWDTESGAVVHVLKGHTSTVSAGVFSSDGKWVLTGSHDGTARIWAAESGAVHHVLKMHTDAVTSVAFSEDGKRVLTGSKDGTARIWDAKLGTQQQKLSVGDSWVCAVAFSRDGRRVLTGSRDDLARIWDTESEAVVHVLKGHTSTVSAGVFSSDGKWVLTGSHDGTARIWAAESGAVHHVLKMHTDAVTSVAFSEDGKRVLTGSKDKTTRVWNLDESKPQKVQPVR